MSAKPPGQNLAKVDIVDYHYETTMARTPIHPGEILADELEELGVEIKRLPSARRRGRRPRLRFD